MEQTPIPQGLYRPAVRHGSLIFTAGMTPRRNGVLLQTGKLSPARPLEDYREAAVQAASNALAAARGTLEEGERIVQILSLTVWVNAEPGFTDFARAGDLVSRWLCEQLGEAGVGARAAIGAASLPGEAPLEVRFIAAAGPA